MKEGWYYINNKKCYVQRLDGVLHTWRPNDGWKKLDKWDVIASIIDDLQGTCKSLCDVEEEYGLEGGELDFHELNEIDQHIFLCDFCGWWYEVGDDCDYNGETYCPDCYDEVKREDEWEYGNKI